MRALTISLKFSHIFVVVTSSRPYEYPHPSGTTNWMAPEPSPSAKPHSDAPQPFWRVNPQDSPLTPAFSPYTPNLPPQNWPASHTEASPREDVNWSVPQRSMSYNNLEGLQNQQSYSPYHHPPPGPISDHYTTKPRVLQSSGMYPPPPISTAANPAPPPETASTAPPETTQPHSANSLPPVPFSNWQQPYSYQKPPSASSEYHGAWNSPHGNQPHVQGEATHPPPTTYGYGEPAPPMYYQQPHSGR